VAEIRRRVNLDDREKIYEQLREFAHRLKSKHRVTKGDP